MNTETRDKSILEHIVRYCESIEEATNRFGNTMEAFSKDKILRDVCSMYLLQIGELSNNLSQELRGEHEEIPWRDIKAMRNVVAHNYGMISASTLFETIVNDIPTLKASCLEIIEESQDNG